jgi:GNAT superfamily N-acetyltransferase
VRLRKPAATDRTPLEAILRATQAFSEEEIAVALELIDATLAPGGSPDYQLIVAEVEGAVAGYACWGATPLTEGVFDLYWIATDPRLHGAGVGRKLVEHVEWDVRELGGRTVLIETASKPSYDKTRGFYLRTGYLEVARVPDFYKVGDDKVIYMKRVREA